MDLIIPPSRSNENNRAYAWRVLRQNIMTLRLPPGEPINEQELSQALDMSRTPVHEAVTRLHSEWLVDVYPQRGTAVSLIDPQLVKEGYETRVLLESALLIDSAGKIGRTDARRLIDCLHRQEAVFQSSPDAVDDLIQLDDEFHRLMYSFGGRSHTWTATRGLVSHYDRLRYLDAMDGEADLSQVIEQHRQLCDYLLMGLPAGFNAREYLTAHLTSYRGNLMHKIAMHPKYFTIV